MWQYANGIDNSEVQYKYEKPKGVGNSTTLPMDINDVSKLEEILLALTEQVTYRLRKQNDLGYHVQADTLEELAEKLDIPYISAGFVFREMAAERGMSVLEFSEFAEGNDDIDKEIDKRQAEKAKSAENLIVEGRLSAYFVDNADLRIWLFTPFDVRSKHHSYGCGQLREYYGG